MKHFLLSFLLAGSLHAQVLWSESFNDGVIPPNWSKRFGRVIQEPNNPANFVYNFANRGSGNETFSAPIDLSGGNFTLSFDFCSDAYQNHGLLVGLASDTSHASYYAGSDTAAPFLPLVACFDCEGGWTRVCLDISPWLLDFGPSQLSSMMLTFIASNNGNLSSLPVFLDNVSVSAIPELPSSGCIAGFVALGVVLLRRKRSCLTKP